jgi:glycosyltransferase involved in cell wall biosynthesis
MRIILLSEAPMCQNAGGISQTLYNIFSFINPADILCIAPENEIKSYPPSKPFQDRYIGYNFEIINFKTNRLTRHFAGFRNWINYSFLKYRKFNKVKTVIKLFKPDVVISCPNGNMGGAVHNVFLKEFKGVVLTYFMDDWMYQSNLSWLGGNIQDSVKRMLIQSTGWMMISNELTQVLKERYNIDNDNILVIRNPVDLSHTPQYEPLQKKEKYTLAYAGAIWPMHLDSLIYAAQAVNILRQTFDIDFVIYTMESYWEWRKGIFEPLGIRYGGNIPYERIHSILNKADILILVSSFSGELYTHSKASLQTKITDYLKSQRLIVSIGPDYSANHNFLNQYDCGICIENPDVVQIAAKLGEILNNIENYSYKITNGFQVLRDQFGYEVVHKRFRNFLMFTLNVKK